MKLEKGLKFWNFFAWKKFENISKHKSLNCKELNRLQETALIQEVDWNQFKFRAAELFETIFELWVSDVDTVTTWTIHHTLEKYVAEIIAGHFLAHPVGLPS